LGVGKTKYIAILFQIQTDKGEGEEWEEWEDKKEVHE
jgi:hypothetical protein